jgi:predicted nucleotidyltransferase
MLSLNSYLSDLASDYFISHGTIERGSINTSIETLKTRLKAHFGNDVLSIEVFGSWKRDTTLPRKYDSYSDVDIMIVFDHERLQFTPETYRNWLKNFAELKYGRSVIQKDFPTVRIDMTHITFDLIPTKKTNWLITSYYIPDVNNHWMPTEPNKFTNEVISSNTINNSKVKPVLRLIKAWNSFNGRPFNSFELEQLAVHNIYWGLYPSTEKAFFAVCKIIPNWTGTANRNQKVSTLRNNLEWVEHYLANEDITKAKQWLHKILPQT